MTHYFSIETSYDGKLFPDFDGILEHAVRKKKSFSGMWFGEKPCREVGWEFRTRASAEKARQKIHKMIRKYPKAKLESPILEAHND